MLLKTKTLDSACMDLPLRKRFPSTLFQVFLFKKEGPH